MSNTRKARIAPTPKPTGRRWIADVGELFPEELDAATAAIGTTGKDIDVKGFAFNAACAVVFARREDPSIPMESWRRIRLKDLDVIDHGDIDDADDIDEDGSEADPTGGG